MPSHDDDQTVAAHIDPHGPQSIDDAAGGEQMLPDRQRRQSKPVSTKPDTTVPQAVPEAQEDGSRLSTFHGTETLTGAFPSPAPVFLTLQFESLARQFAVRFAYAIARALKPAAYVGRIPWTSQGMAVRPARSGFRS